MTIYFQDGTSFVCGPQIITLGVNFTKDDGCWSTHYIIESSPPENATTLENGLLISLVQSDPISIPFVVIMMALVIVVLLSYKKYYYDDKENQISRGKDGLLIQRLNILLVPT